MISRYSFKFKNFRLPCSLDGFYDSKLEKVLVLDTGSVNTIISLRVLLYLGLITESTAFDFVKNLSSSLIGIKTFVSASRHSIDCIPCVLHNIYLGSKFISDFYFYLPLDNKSELNLLGLDFIRFCSITKTSETKLILHDLNISRYEQNFILGARNTKPLNINFISSEKDLAAYFRSYYKED